MAGSNSMDWLDAAVWSVISELGNIIYYVKISMYKNMKIIFGLKVAHAQKYAVTRKWNETFTSSFYRVIPGGGR